MIDFGIQFFPAVDPATRSAQSYWADALALVDLVDPLGYGSVRTVEHYFHPYGGYSPSPLTFLAAASMRAKKARMITGAVLPVFNNPLKLASEIGLVDALTEGRLEVGFARAFLPHEFARFGVSIDESRARFDDGVAMIQRLLTQEHVDSDGPFHRFKDVTIYPRPTQRPHPPFWIAANQTPQTFEQAGRLGFGIMGIPLIGAKMRELIGLYRKAWKEAGHAGQGRVMLAFHMYCSQDAAEARASTEHELNAYMAAVVEAASDWGHGVSMKDYPGYDKAIEALSKETWESQVANGAAWIGTPENIIAQVRAYHDMVGGFDIASMQVNFGALPLDKAQASMKLFAQTVMPKFR